MIRWMFSGAKNSGVSVVGASLAAAVAGIGAEGVEVCPAKNNPLHLDTTGPHIGYSFPLVA